MITGKSTSKAASLMGKRSVEARKEKLGDKEFTRYMRKIGKLGGRPKGSTKKSEVQ